jgi:hypothetical protein
MTLVICYEYENCLRFNAVGKLHGRSSRQDGFLRDLVTTDKVIKIDS